MGQSSYSGNREGPLAHISSSNEAPLQNYKKTNITHNKHLSISKKHESINSQQQQEEQINKTHQSFF
jgi:hypothetical protein